VNALEESATASAVASGTAHWTAAEHARLYALSRRLEMERERRRAHRVGAAQRRTQAQAKKAEKRAAAVAAARARAASDAARAAAAAENDAHEAEARQQELARARKDAALKQQRRHAETMRYISAIHEQVQTQMSAKNAGSVTAADAEAATPVLAWDTERHGVGMPDVAVRPSVRGGHSHLVIA
jgi:hypothetical protein